MSRYESTFFERIYQRAGSADRLPWYREEPPELLQRAVAEHEHAGRALDLGCGAGLYSIYLAQQGYDVNGLDFTAGAVEMAKRNAEEAGVHLDLQRADVLAWDGEGPFDLVLDSGCLHGFADTERRRYKANLLRWLAPGGDYVLVHFEKRHAFDWRPMGPRRIPTKKIIALFAPELELVQHASQTAKVPLPVGPTVKVGNFWFRRRSDD